MVIVLFLTWMLGVNYGAKHVEIPEPEPQIVTVYATPDPEAQEFMNRYQKERSTFRRSTLLDGPDPR